jgi:hypothetical protein
MWPANLLGLHKIWTCRCREPDWSQFQALCLIPDTFKNYLNSLKVVCWDVKKLCTVLELCIFMCTYCVTVLSPAVISLESVWNVFKRGSLPNIERYHYRVTKFCFKHTSIFVRWWEILRNWVNNWVRTAFLRSVLSAFSWGTSKKKLPGAAILRNRKYAEASYIRDILTK